MPDTPRIVLLGHYPPYDKIGFADKGRVFDTKGIAPTLIAASGGGATNLRPTILIEHK